MGTLYIIARTSKHSGRDADEEYEDADSEISEDGRSDEDDDYRLGGEVEEEREYEGKSGKEQVGGCWV